MGFCSHVRVRRRFRERGGSGRSDRRKMASQRKRREAQVAIQQAPTTAPERQSSRSILLQPRYLLIPIAGTLVLALVLLKNIEWKASNKAGPSHPAGWKSDPPPIEAKLASSDPIERIRAVQSLAPTHNADTARLLLDRLTDPDERVRIAAAEQLAALKDKTVLPRLVELFHSTSAQPAGIALGGIAGPGEKQLVQEMLRSPDPVVRRSGVSAMARISQENYRQEQKFADDEVFKASLVDPDETVRIAAARELRMTAPRADALKLMAWALDQSSPAVRRTAAIELGAFAGDAREILKKHVDDENENVKAAVTATLRRIGEESK